MVTVLGLSLAYFVADKFWFSSSDQRLTPEASIAVLPFTNMTRDDDSDPFIDGIHNDLLTHLSRIESLRTTSRTSVLQYEETMMAAAEIAAELGVATVLEASVQRLGDRVRVNAQLINAAANELLWAEQYDRELTATNVFEIQSEIAIAIADQLQAKLTTDERQRLDSVPTQSIAALESYFTGKQLLEERTAESLTRRGRVLRASCCDRSGLCPRLVGPCGCLHVVARIFGDNRPQDGWRTINLRRRARSV